MYPHQYKRLREEEERACQFEERIVLFCQEIANDAIGQMTLVTLDQAAELAEWVSA